MPPAATSSTAIPATPPRPDRWSTPSATKSWSLPLLLEVDAEELVQRLVLRGQEQGRSDDTEDVIRNRLAVYEDQTAPLVEYYESAGRLARVQGLGTIPEVFGRLIEVLAA